MDQISWECRTNHKYLPFISKFQFLKNIKNENGFTIIEGVLAGVILGIIILGAMSTMNYAALQNVSKRNKADLLALDQQLQKLAADPKFCGCNFRDGANQITFNGVAGSTYDMPARTNFGTGAPANKFTGMGLWVFDSSCTPPTDAKPNALAAVGRSPKNMSKSLTVSSIKLENTRLASNNPKLIGADLVIRYNTTAGITPRPTMIRDLLISADGANKLGDCISVDEAPKIAFTSTFSASWNSVDNPPQVTASGAAGLNAEVDRKSSTATAAFTIDGLATGWIVENPGFLRFRVSGSHFWYEKIGGCGNWDYFFGTTFLNALITVNYSTDNGGTWPVGQSVTSSFSSYGLQDFVLDNRIPVLAGDTMRFSMRTQFDIPKQSFIPTPTDPNPTTGAPIPNDCVDSIEIRNGFLNVEYSPILN